MDDRDSTIGSAASASPEANARQERERAAEAAGTPAPGAAVGAPAGAAGGALAGGAAGVLTLGPIGAAIGAIAGAVGGAWTGMAAGQGADYGNEHDEEYRRHYEASPDRTADREYERVRPAYQLGHLAALNPDYAGRDFDAIEPDLRHGWTDDMRQRHGEWAAVRTYAREAYVMRGTPRTRGETFAARDIGGTESHQRASFADPIPDGTDDSVLRTSERYAHGEGTDQERGR